MRFSGNVPEEEKIVIMKKFRIKIIVFLSGGVVFLAVTIMRIIMTYDSVFKLTQTTTTLFSVAPVIFSAAILVPLLMTMQKLRSYHKLYGMKLAKKKLIVHFSVCIMILLLQICDCIVHYTAFDLGHNFANSSD